MREPAFLKRPSASVCCESASNAAARNLSNGKQRLYVHTYTVLDAAGDRSYQYIVVLMNTAMIVLLVFRILRNEAAAGELTAGERLETVAEQRSLRSCCCMCAGRLRKCGERMR